MNTAETERFLAKVEFGGEDECWLWLASTYNGYGQLAINRRPRGAHRLAYELWVGSIPSGLFVLHTCDVKHCVNPAHLFVGTQKDNMEDWWAKGLAPSGEKSVTAKLTAEDVLWIREWAPLNRHQRIADVFGISRGHVSRIVNRGEWRHI